jgi:hypothetical protein
MGLSECWDMVDNVGSGLKWRSNIEGRFGVFEEIVEAADINIPFDIYWMTS